MAKHSFPYKPICFKCKVLSYGGYSDEEEKTRIDGERKRKMSKRNGLVRAKTSLRSEGLTPQESLQWFHGIHHVSDSISFNWLYRPLCVKSANVWRYSSFASVRTERKIRNEWWQLYHRATLSMLLSARLFSYAKYMSCLPFFRVYASSKAQAVNRELKIRRSCSDRWDTLNVNRNCWWERWMFSGLVT